MILAIDGTSTSEWEARAGIDRIFRVLGSPNQHSLLGPVQMPFVHRSNWECGCALDYFVDDTGGGFKWRGCITHSERAEASFMALVAG